MFTTGGARGSWRAPRSIPFGLLALLGVLAVGPSGSSARSHGKQIVLAGYGSSAVTSSDLSDHLPAGPQGNAIGSFGIAGSVTGLFPGSSHTLKLTVTNPQSFAIVVTSIATTVHNASASCTAANLSVGAFSGQLSVSASGSAKITVHATLAYGAPNACIGAKFPLVYTGLARS